MLKRKNKRDKGKIKLSFYFQKFNKGDKVSVNRETSLQPKFPKQIQGRSGAVENLRGKYYLVRMNDLNKIKFYLIHPAHLRKIS
jgi:ribosomal protein L21E